MTLASFFSLGPKPTSASTLASTSSSSLSCGSFSMISKLLLIGVIAIVFQTPPSSGHGRLMNPPSRASMWRVGFDNPPDFSDNQGFCGGFVHQYYVNGGKCGICGDPWDASPRDHEVGGRYANGILAKTYRPGDDIDVEIEITANHLGYFTFKLCENNDVTRDPGQECFDSTILPVLPDMTPHFYLRSSDVGMYRMKLRLPENLTCSQCILQWTYTCGNNWGICSDGQGGLGCGPQEHFRACSDIAIKGQPIDQDIFTNTIDDTKSTTTHFVTSDPPFTNRPTSTMSTSQGSGNMTADSITNTIDDTHSTTTTYVTSDPSYTSPSRPNSTNTPLVTSDPPFTSPSRPVSTTTHFVSSDPPFTNEPTTFPSTTSTSQENGTSTADPITADMSTTTTDQTTTTSSQHLPIVCKPTTAFDSVSGMEEWCNLNCNTDLVFCPESHCRCHI